MAQFDTLDDFLSQTMLREKPESVERAFHLAKGYIADDPIYYDVSKLKYGNFGFTVGAFFRDDECKAFQLYTSQSRILDDNGNRMRGDEPDIDQVFRDLAADLNTRYGPAPHVEFGSNSTDLFVEGRCDVYIWANGKYALMLMLYDDVTSHGLKLIHYKVGEERGEFTGKEQLNYLANLYASQAGKLPANWPVARGEAPPPGAIETPGGNPLRESIDKKPLELAPQDGTVSKVDGKDDLKLPVWYAVTVLVALVLLVGWWVNAKRGKTSHR